MYSLWKHIVDNIINRWHLQVQIVDFRSRPTLSNRTAKGSICRISASFAEIKAAHHARNATLLLANAVLRDGVRRSRRLPLQSTELTYYLVLLHKDVSNNFVDVRLMERYPIDHVYVRMCVLMIVLDAIFRFHHGFLIRGHPVLSFR